MPSVIVATFWRGFPFWVISFLAALQSVPPELYEAAAMDGASAWQRFRHVTLPSIRHVILVVCLISTIWTTNSFENVWLMTQGGPSDATMTFPVLAYFGLQSLRIGEAAAVSVSMLPVFAVLALIVAAPAGGLAACRHGSARSGSSSPTGCWGFWPSSSCSRSTTCSSSRSSCRGTSTAHPRSGR